jgi:RND family efflux transporter MFP subunit
MAQDQSPLSVKVPGRVRTITVDLGSLVRAGDLVAEVDAQDYELGLAQARAALGQARAKVGLPLEGDDDQVEVEKTSTVKQARAVLEEKRKDRNRIITLSEQGIASQSEQEVAQSAFEVAANKYEDAIEEARNRLAILAQRRVEYDIARKQLSDTRVVAPFEGAVQERRANLGEYLQAGAPVVTLVRMDPLRLRLEVPERDAGRVRQGQAVRVFVEGDTNAHTGVVKRLSPAITAQSRMLVVEADVHSDGVLRPGAFARAEIVTASDTPALTVPVGSLVTFAGIEKVLVAENGAVKEKFITTGDRASNQIEVTSGLKAGELVLVNPGGLRAGRAVTATVKE